MIVDQLREMQARIRDDLMHLKHKMARLQSFIDKGYTVEKCAEGEHDWSYLDSDHYWHEAYVAKMGCTKCGIRQYWEYKFTKIDSDDEWADMRLEESKGEEE